MHIDFQELVAGETVAMYCPISYIGTPDGVRHEGGILDQILHQLHIEVDPSAIPNHIDVDVTSLKLGKSLHVGDLKLPAGIKVLDDEGTTICIVQASKAGVEAVPADGAPEPELIRKVKPDDEK
jgi:large subunit ribosomal protein L25